MDFLEEINKKELKYIKKVSQRENIFGDNIAEVSLYDFSMANLNIDSRIEAVTLVASACYANPNAINKNSLFDRLERESLGLPSSSFEFIPVLLSKDKVNAIFDLYTKANIETTQLTPILKYSQFSLDIPQRLITNYRAIVNTYNELQSNLEEDISYILHWYNTEEECKLLRPFYRVFLSKIDLVTRTQYIRHREASWQELSRRYVKGVKVPFEVYIKNKGENFKDDLQASIDNHIDTSIYLYEKLIKSGVPAQDARRVIPQGAYTIIWSGWFIDGLENFFWLRLDSHSQLEMRKLAEAKLDMIQKDL